METDPRKHQRKGLQVRWEVPCRLLCHGGPPACAVFASGGWLKNGEPLSLVIFGWVKYGDTSVREGGLFLVTRNSQVFYEIIIDHPSIQSFVMYSFLHSGI